jgi:hypothetical protein
MLRVKVISCQNDTELAKLEASLCARNSDRDDFDRSLQEFAAVGQNLHSEAARLAELACVNDSLRAEVEAVPKEGKGKAQRLTKADEKPVGFGPLFGARGKKVTYLGDRLDALRSNEATLTTERKERRRREMPPPPPPGQSKAGDSSIPNHGDLTEPSAQQIDLKLAFCWPA